MESTENLLRNGAAAPHVAIRKQGDSRGPVSRRKHVFTTQIDQLIRDVYLHRPRRDPLDRSGPPGSGFAGRGAGRGEARGKRQNGNIYLIREKDVRRFVLEHPSDIDLRKVDQLWFLDMLTNGLARTA